VTVADRDHFVDIVSHTRDAKHYYDIKKKTVFEYIQYSLQYLNDNKCYSIIIYISYYTNQRYQKTDAILSRYLSWRRVDAHARNYTTNRESCPHALTRGKDARAHAMMFSNNNSCNNN